MPVEPCFSYFVGRKAESERISGQLAVDEPVVVVGEMGIGKTTLLRRVAAASGRRVFEGGALSTLAWVSGLALRRALGRQPTNGDAAAVALEVESSVGPGVLLLDDLQWADTLTLDVATVLAGRIGLLIGVRGDPAAAGVLDRLTESGFTRVDIGPLPDDEARTLVESIRPGLAPPRQRSSSRRRAATR